LAYLDAQDVSEEDLVLGAALGAGTAGHEGLLEK
jgi:hypothetical protein